MFRVSLALLTEEGLGKGLTGILVTGRENEDTQSGWAAR